MPSRVMIHSAFCFSFFLYLLLVNACLGLNWFLARFDHTVIKSFIYLLFLFRPTAMTIRHKYRPTDGDDWLLLSCISIGCRLRSLREKYGRFYRCKDRLCQLHFRTFVFHSHSFLALVAFLVYFLFCLRTFFTQGVAYVVYI